MDKFVGAIISCGVTIVFALSIIICILIPPL